jgi:hypothetical protein
MVPSRVPRADEIVLLSQPLLKAVIKITPRLLDNVRAKWAFGGDAGEIMTGVNVNADHLEILTTKAGCDQIWEELSEYQETAPVMIERKLERDADIDGKMLPVLVRSYLAEFRIGGAKLEVHGDEQIKVGDWDWGDPLDFTADYTYIPGGGKAPLVPLALKSELDLGLGWLDRVQLISDAVMQKHHSH